MKSGLKYSFFSMKLDLNVIVMIWIVAHFISIQFMWLSYSWTSWFTFTFWLSFYINLNHVKSCCNHCDDYDDDDNDHYDNNHLNGDQLTDLNKIEF